MRRTNENLDRERRKQMLDAALQCFLQFGYSKTSMDDVAKKANLSRPLIYLKFKSKQDLVLVLYVDFTEEALTQAATVLKSKRKRSTKEILLEVTEIVTIRAWEKVAGHPMASEFYPICQQQFPKESERIERDVVKIYQEIFEGDKGKAEVFLLAVDGLHTDTPTSKVLRKRLGILIDQFA